MATDIQSLCLKLREANRAALTALGLLESQAPPHSTKGIAMTCIENAIVQLGGQTATAKLFGLAGYQAVQSWIAQGRVPADYCPRIEILTGVPCEDLNDRVEWSLIRGTDHATQLQRAIANARDVYESVPVAGQVLDYLQAVLDYEKEKSAADEWRVRALKAEAAVAALPAQTGIESSDAFELRAQWAAVDREIGGKAMHAAAFEDGLNCRIPAPGAENASITKETHTGAGAAPVAGADPFRVSARRAVMHQARADLDQAADFDQAAAAMAAESAQKFADAERWLAARATAAPSTIINTLVVKIDTSEIDAALAKVAELKAGLVSALPVTVAAAARIAPPPAGEATAPAGDRLGISQVRDAVSRASAELRR